MIPFTVSELLSANLPRHRDRVALVSGSRQVTYGALSAHVDALAAWLHDHGVRRGDCFGIHLHKSIEEVVATFAAARLGAVFVNVHPQWTLAQLQYVMDDCGIRHLLTGERRAREMHQAGLLDQLQHVITLGRAPDHPHAVAWSTIPTEPACPISHSVSSPVDADLAALIYTSGSTGNPKGVMLTHLNIVHGARSVASYLGNTSNDRVLSILPLSFDYGLNQLTTMCLAGGTLVLQPVSMPAEIIKSIVSNGITGLAAVPPLWIQLVRYLQDEPAEMPTLRYLTNSGGKIPDPILEALPTTFPGSDVVLMYGLTEAFRSTYLPPEMFSDKMGSMGRAIPNVEVFVVDPQEGLCGPGQQGELVHRGSLISQGYWGQPELTAEKIRPCPQLNHLIGDEPVLFSGDLVRWDEDGFLWFVSRMDAMIKCSGFRISPTEVEDVVFRSRLVGDVVAFAAEDELLGQAVHIAVTAAGPDPVDLARLDQFCHDQMPHYMVPRKTYLWDGPMPRTGSGKIDRPSVIATCQDGMLLSHS